MGIALGKMMNAGQICLAPDYMYVPQDKEDEAVAGVSQGVSAMYPTLLDNDLDNAVLADGTPIAPGIPFGHKAALSALSKGQPVRKYGVVIGHATADISSGDHVHFHNLA